MDEAASHVTQMVSARFHHTYDMSFGVALVAVVAAAAAVEAAAAAVEAAAVGAV